MLDVGLSRRFWTIAFTTLVFLWVVRFGIWGSYESVERVSSPSSSTKPILDNNNNPSSPNDNDEPAPPPTSESSSPEHPEPIDQVDLGLDDDGPQDPETAVSEPPEKKYGQIIDKVATITDTQYTDRLIPLIMHFHAVLGPEWPIVFFTSNETLNEYILPLLSDSPLSSTQPRAADTTGSDTFSTTTTTSTTTAAAAAAAAPPAIATPSQILTPPAGSASFRRAVERGSISVRTIPAQFNLTSRDGVNIYLSRPWLYEQLAPATHVLVFQADAMICANSPRRPEDFFDYAWVGAPLHPRTHYYNGGLCLRNRTMIMEILREGADWEADTYLHKNWTEGGEDIWFSKKMDLRGARLPSADVALRFAAEHSWHVKPAIKGQGFRKEYEMRPWGFHKVHVYARDKLDEIAAWCPEISLAAKGRLEPST